MKSEGIVEALDRIAAALERIADAVAARKIAGVVQK